MGAVINIARRFGDGLSNLVSRMGTDRDKSTHSVYGEVILDDRQLFNAYRGSWLPRKIIDIPALDSCRKWRDWQADAAQIEKIEAEEKRLNVRGKVLEARTKARLWGGAAILIGTGDLDPSQPLDPEKIKAGGVKYLTVVTRRELTADEIDREAGSEFYGKPVSYTLNSKSGQAVTIHPSRLVIFQGAPVPDEDLNVNKGWSDSVLTSILEAVRNADSTAANVASLVFEAKVDIIRAPNFMASLSDPEYESRWLNRFTLANMGKGVNGTLILDKEEEYDSKSTNFANLPDIIDRFLQIVAGAADVPLTRLLGTSPGGLNSTGESDLRNYYDRISAGQQIEMQPAMYRLDEAIIRSALGARPPEVHYIWSSLWQISDKERADIGKISAETIKTLNDTGLFPPEALANSGANMLVENSILPGFEQEIEDAGGLPDYEMEAEQEAEQERLRLEAAATGQRGAPVGDATFLDRYNPNQPRNREGEWSSGGGGSSVSGGASLSSAETEAVTFYKNKSYKKVNTGLRKGSVPDDVKGHVDHLDSAIAKQSGFTKSTTLYRGIQSKALADQARKDPKSLIGKDMVDNAFMSTSTSTGAAQHFAGTSFGGSKSGVIMSITAPKGTKALSLDGFTKNKNVFRENEMLLPRGSKVKIKKVSEWNGAVLIEGSLE